MGKYVLYHSTPNIIKGFDIDHFNEDSLFNNTKEFGIYFNFVDYEFRTNPVNKIIMGQCADYGLMKSHNHTAYMYISVLEVDDEHLLDSNDLMSESEFCDLFGNSSKYNAFKNNQQIITTIVSYFHNKGYEWSKIANYLSERGYYGHIRGKSTGFGQLTLWSNEILCCLEIAGCAMFKNKNELKLISY